MKRATLIVLLSLLTLPVYAASSSGHREVWLSSLNQVATTGAGTDYRLITSGLGGGFYESWGNLVWKTSFTGSPTAITINLEGSNDGGTTWVTVDSSTSTTGESRSLQAKFWERLRCNIAAYTVNSSKATCELKGVGQTTINAAYPGVTSDGALGLNIAGNATVGTTCPAGAPAGSICFLGSLYRDGSEFVGGDGAALPANSAGYLKNNGTGTLSWDTPAGGTGTVTHGTGALTSTAVIVGNNADDVKASAATVDADGKGTFPGGVVAGAGGYVFNGGTNAAGALIDDGSGNIQPRKIASGDVDTTVAKTSDLSSYVPTSRTVAGKALSGNITLACSDLSDDGDACAKSTGTTSGTVAAGDHTHTFSVITARPWSCQTGVGDGLNAITAGTYLQTFCYNDTGATVTLSGLKCYSDNAGTSTMAVTNGAGTALLTGAVTCSATFAAGTQSATITLANGDFLKFTFVADGTSKQTTWVVTGSY